MSLRASPQTGVAIPSGIMKLLDMGEDDIGLEYIKVATSF